jgi:glycerol uptake facilitator protein
VTSPLFGEFMGTLVLILLGDGVVAGLLLKRSKAEGAGWLAVTAAWCFAVLAGVYTALACGSPDAHINPAVTLGFAVITGNYAKVLPYAAAQLLGAFAGAALVWLHYSPHWKETPDASLKLAVFCTAPAIRAPAANLASEVIGTLTLVFLVACLSSKGVAAAGGTGSMGPFLVSCVVWGIGLSLGGTTGYAINPARDLGPRLAHALLPISGKGPSDWSYAAVPIAGPLLGAGLAGLLVRLAKL